MVREIARTFLGFAALAVAAMFATSASAEVKTFRDWLVACDNVRTCTAYALRENSSGAFLRLDRDGAAAAPPRFTVLVDAEKDTKIELAFDDATLPGLPKGPITATSGEDLTHIEIATDAVETFTASLRKAGKIIVSRAEPKPGEERVIGEISLSGAVATMLWIDEHQRRLLTVTALIKVGNLPASVIPAVPALPVVHAATPAAAPADKIFPKAVLARGHSICGTDDPKPQPGEVNALSGNLLLYWFECRQMSGAYNAWSGFLIAPRDHPEAARMARLPYPPGEVAIAGMSNQLLVNAGFDEKTMKLTTFAKGRGPGDCGSAGEWVFDGTAFRLTRYQSMPTCGGLISDQWPVIYRAKVE